MRRHYAPYFKGFENIKEIRSRLVQSMEPDEVRGLLEQIRLQYATVAPA
jgi:tRNA-dihydrouridine synthase